MTSSCPSAATSTTTPTAVSRRRSAPRSTDHRRPGSCVDLAEVTYCDSCGLRVLLAAQARARDVGASFVLRGAHGQPARALKLTGLDQVFG